MLEAGISENEEERLKKLKSYGILDTDAEKSFDRITDLVSVILGVPIALISFVDERRQWFKSCHGLGTCETSRSVSFCAHAVLQQGVFWIEDALEDERFFDNPLVTGEPLIRFYAGAPIITEDNYNLGTLCAIDSAPRKLTSNEASILTNLASVVLDELELRKKRHELSQQLKIRDRFFSIIAHDLRGPFNSLLGFSNPELVDKESTREQLLDDMRHIHKSARQALDMTNNLLTWATLQLNQTSLQMKKTELEGLVACVVGSLSAIAEAKHISIELDCPAPVIAIADDFSVTFAVRNLLSNAIKFSHKNSKILVTIGRVCDKAVISIQDTGVGIDQKLITNLFDIDKKTSTTGTMGEKGTGLGLPLCKEFVMANNGELSLTSIRGKGSTFKITLPLGGV